MGKETGINWTDHTFNPWWGCHEVAPECDNCYARTLAERFGFDVWGKEQDRRFFGDKHWDEPLAWNERARKEGRPHMVFCASMADVFDIHPDVAAYRTRLWRLVEKTPWLKWQILTKRPQNINRMVPERWLHEWPDNAWMGTSVGRQQTADNMIPFLLRVPAKVRFLSCEPLLERVVLQGEVNPTHYNSFLRNGMGQHIHWVIVGGESGNKARPMNPQWARSLRDQCQATETPFFFKQNGEYIAQSQLLPEDILTLPDSICTKAKPIEGDYVFRVGKHTAGRLLDRRTWDEFPR